MQAKHAAEEFGAETLSCRVRTDYEPQIFRNILSDFGLKRIAGRIEYQTEISLLPIDDGSPLKWKTVKDLGWSEKQTAEFTDKAVKGALDIDPDEKAEDFVQDERK